MERELQEQSEQTSVDASESSNAQVAPFFDTPIDDTMTLSAYNAQDAHFSWFDKMAASIRENTQEQFARNWLMFTNYATRGFNALDWGYDIPDVSDSMSSVASMNVGKYANAKQIEETTTSKILSPEQLNKMYETDKFKVSLREDLANDYLYNVQKREENEYIMNYKEPLGFFSQLGTGALGSLFEPTDIAATILTSGIFKGASLAKVAASMAVESAASSALAEKGREQGSGADFSYGNVAVGTALGTVLGTGIHFGVERLKGKDAITPQEAVKAARDTSPPANESADKLNEVVVNGSTEVKNDVINKVEDMVNSEADVDLDTVIKSVVPDKNETSIASVLESVQSSVGDVASANKIKSYSTVYGVKNEHGVTVYDTDFNTAIDKAVLSNKSVVEASVLETDTKHLDLDEMTLDEAYSSSHPIFQQEGIISNVVKNAGEKGTLLKQHVATLDEIDKALKSIDKVLVEGNTSEIVSTSSPAMASFKQEFKKQYNATEQFEFNPKQHYLFKGIGATSEGYFNYKNVKTGESGSVDLDEATPQFMLDVLTDEFTTHKKSINQNPDLGDVGQGIYTSASPDVASNFGHKVLKFKLSDDFKGYRLSEEERVSRLYVDPLEKFAKEKGIDITALKEKYYDLLDSSISIRQYAMDLRTHLVKEADTIEVNKILVAAKEEMTASLKAEGYHGIIMDMKSPEPAVVIFKDMEKVLPDIPSLKEKVLEVEANLLNKLLDGSLSYKAFTEEIAKVFKSSKGTELNKAAMEAYANVVDALNNIPMKHFLSMKHNMTDMDIMEDVAKMFNVNSFKLNNKIYDLKDSVVKAKDVKLTKEMFKDKPQSFLDKVKASPIFKNPEADKWVTEAKKIELANPKIVELESSNATIINNLKQVNKEGSVNTELQKALDEVDAHSKVFEAQYSLLKSATACLFGGKK